MKICENPKEGNSNHHERFHNKRVDISTRYNDLWLFLVRTSLLIVILQKKKSKKIEI